MKDSEAIDSQGKSVFFCATFVEIGRILPVSANPDHSGASAQVLIEAALLMTCTGVP
jgi:hypothetical protein